MKTERSVKMATSLGIDPDYIPHEFRPMVYVAGPYRYPDPVDNTRNAIVVAERLELSGLITACVPHVNLVWSRVHPHDAEFWLDYDIAFLSKCDALLRIPGISDGADDEILYAKEVGMSVFHNEADVLEWAKEWLSGR